MERGRGRALHSRPGPMSANFFAGIILNPQQLRRGWTDARQAILGQIMEAVVTLEDHLLSTAPDPIIPQNSHIFNMLVVIPRCQTIDGITHIDGKGWVVVAMHPKVVMDVAVDHFGYFRFLIPIKGETNDGSGPGGIFRAVIAKLQRTTNVTYQARPTSLANVKEANGFLASFVGGSHLFGQTLGMPVSRKLKAVPKVSLAQIVTIFHCVRTFLHVVKGFIGIHKGGEAAAFLLFHLPPLAPP